MGGTETITTDASLFCEIDRVQRCYDKRIQKSRRAVMSAMRERVEDLLEMTEWITETSQDNAEVSRAVILENALRDWLKEDKEQGDAE
ncbi:MAG: hypothetical protein Q8Q12_00625 [bacterium]|nr:hypothetical protein [bacterium]